MLDVYYLEYFENDDQELDWDDKEKYKIENDTSLADAIVVGYAFDKYVFVDKFGRIGASVEGVYYELAQQYDFHTAVQAAKGEDLVSWVVDAWKTSTSGQQDKTSTQSLRLSAEPQENKNPYPLLEKPRLNRWRSLRMLDVINSRDT
jgi:hypothetical protein